MIRSVLLAILVFAGCDSAKPDEPPSAPTRSAVIPRPATPRPVLPTAEDTDDEEGDATANEAEESEEADTHVAVTPDRDHDGIPDSVDKCPDQPEDIDGFEDSDGCPDPDVDVDHGNFDGFDEHDYGPDEYMERDRDSEDELVDVIDRCPDSPDADDNDGCPDVR